MRYDTSKAAAYVGSDGIGGTYINNAPAGANPIAWTTRLSIDSAGAMTLTNGSITTPMLAAGAAQQSIGSYIGLPSFSMAPTGGWVLVPGVTCSFTTTGGMLRVEYTLPIIVANAGALIGMAVGFDGAAAYGLQSTTSPSANSGITFGGTLYNQLAAGTHTASLWLLWSVGAITPAVSIYATLDVSEQKR
jgi:hypothetical protein